jgi:hypothetical protein
MLLSCDMRGGADSRRCRPDGQVAWPAGLTSGLLQVPMKPRCAVRNSVSGCACRNSSKQAGVQQPGAAADYCVSMLLKMVSARSVMHGRLCSGVQVWQARYLMPAFQGWADAAQRQNALRSGLTHCLQVCRHALDMGTRLCRVTACVSF